MLYFSGVVHAQMESQSKVPSVQISKQRLERIDQLLQASIDSGWIKHAAGLILLDGKIVYQQYFHKEGEKATAPGLNTIYRIASQTKPITTVAALQLMEEGKLLLTDPVSKYLPEFSGSVVLDKFNEKDSTYTTIPARRALTILDLMTHTAGIAYAGPGDSELSAIYAKAGLPNGLVTDREQFRKQILRQLATLPLAHQPGERFTYGFSTDILGFVIEAITHTSLEAYCRQRIFEPLGMNDTFFYLPDHKQNLLSKIYTENDDKKSVPWKPLSFVSVDFPKMKGTFHSGGEGLTTTISDYSVFLQMLLDKGTYKGRRILSGSSVDLMLQNHISPLTLDGEYFGLGFMITTMAGRQRLFGLPEGSFTWSGFFGTNSWVDPKNKLVCLLFLQQWPISHSEIFDKFKALVYQALEDSN